MFEIGLKGWIIFAALSLSFTLLGKKFTFLNNVSYLFFVLMWIFWAIMVIGMFI